MTEKKRPWLGSLALTLAAVIAEPGKEAYAC